MRAIAEANAAPATVCQSTIHPYATVCLHGKAVIPANVFFAADKPGDRPKS